MSERWVTLTPTDESGPMRAHRRRLPDHRCTVTHPGSSVFGNATSGDPPRSAGPLGPPLKAIQADISVGGSDHVLVSEGADGCSDRQLRR